MTKLRIDYCSYEAAIYATKRWHYSRRMPRGKLIRFGVWEDEVFKGTIIYSRGTAPNLGKTFDLTVVQICELTRIALDVHATPVSKMMAVTARILKKTGLRAIVSYADVEQEHHGGIYQAANYVYVGAVTPAPAMVIMGKRMQYRSAQTKYRGGEYITLEWVHANVDSTAYELPALPKHKYVYPLDEEMRKLVESMKKPAPKPVRGESIDGDAAAPQAAEGVSKRPRRSKSKTGGT